MFEPRTRPVRLLTATAAATMLLGLAGCGSHPSSGSTSTSDAAAAAESSTTSPTGAASSGQSSNGVTQVRITLTGAGGGRCQVDKTSVPAGPVTFTVINESAPAISEIELQSGLQIIGEKENLAPGLGAVSFTNTLDGGSYTIYCPGANPENTSLTVTGKASAAATGTAGQLLNKGAKQYAGYVTSQATQMLAAVQVLQRAVDTGDLTAAKRAYATARPFYEKIESDVDGFVMPGFKPSDNAGNLDYLIDMRASNVDPKLGWSGFHAIERDLFGTGKITAQTKTYAAGLTKNLGTLVTVVKGLTYKPEDLANGAAGLLDEVQRTKITGEEEAYSHIDIADFNGNIEGAEQAFALLQPGLSKIDPVLTAQIVAQFKNVRSQLNQFRAAGQPGGYRQWTAAERNKYAKQLSQAVLALQQPLQKVAEKVATAR